MHMQTVIALAAEARDQRRMHIDHLIRIGAADRLIEDRHEACLYDQIGMLCTECIEHRRAESGGIGIILPHDHARRDIRLCGTFQRIDAGLRADHAGDPAAAEFTARLCVDQCL